MANMSGDPFHWHIDHLPNGYPVWTPGAAQTTSCPHCGHPMDSHHADTQRGYLPLFVCGCGCVVDVDRNEIGA